MRFLGLSVAALSLAAGLSAQTMEQVEGLWKAHRYQDANDAFEALAKKYPTNVDYHVKWGRMLLDRAYLKEAGEEFQKALEMKKDYPPALLGLALGFAGDFDQRATALAKKALAIDSNAVEARAILATIDWLNDKKDTPWDPHAAKGYELTGRFFVFNRRYEEGIQYYRKAIELDPQLDSARSQLGINLMRLGRNEEARKQLEQAYDNGFRDSATNNSLRLMDSYKNFVTFKTDRTSLVLNKKESDLLQPYFEAEMLKIIATYDKKYKMTLDRPVQLEVYPDHDDFAVRTAGLPGMGGILGVTFGYSVAMDSPSGRPPGSFHWAETLWHEMSHVYTLTATGFRVPRWFTEGMAVHEESAVNPEWGDRITPDILRAIKEKKLLPITELDRGYVHPTEPSQQIVSYFQGGRTCDYINEKWGWDTLLAMLHDFGNGEETAEVVRKELKIEPEAFDKQFIEFVENDTRKLVDNFEKWRTGVKELNELSKKKDWDAVIEKGTPLRDLYPDYVEPGSVYEFLASAYREKKNKPAEIAQLEAYVKNGGRSPTTIKSLAKSLEETGNKKEAAAVLERLNYIWPMDNEQHEMLGSLWLDAGNTAGAIREFRAVVVHQPLDPAQAHYDLARALNADHQTDKANEEVFAALETAPGFRPAQKLLLELSKTESK